MDVRRTLVQPVDRRYPQGTVFRGVSTLGGFSMQPTSESLKNHLPMAGLLILTGLLLRGLPGLNRPGANLLPTDWKALAKVALGVLATSQINKSLQWTPPPWLAGMETVAVIHPLTSGFVPQNLKQLAIIAPVVGGIVELASRLNDDFAPELKEQFRIPKVITRLAISVGIGLLGLKLFPHLMKSLQKAGWLSKATGTKTGSVLASSLTTCARGCTPGGIICLSEIGELFGGLSGGLSSKFQQERAAR